MGDSRMRHYLHSKKSSGGGAGIMSFGRYRGSYIGEVPNSYLSWLLRQDWFEDKDEFEDVESELRWRNDNNVYVEDD